MPIICQRCNKRPATIQTQQLIDGMPYVVALCQQCFDELQVQASNTSHLDKYGRDLTALAKEDKLDPVIGRKNEIERVVHILSRRTKNNPVLIGDPGVGKTAIVEGLAQRIAEGTVPETLQGKRVVSLDLPLMLAGAAHRGQFEERLKKTIEEVVKAEGQIILFIDELHTVVGAGAAQGAIDAANMLKPSLARGQLQTIGATTLDEYHKYIEKDGALERRFQPVSVSEPSIEDTIEILTGLAPRYEQHHHVKISNEAIKAACELSDRYVNDRFLPDKAVDLLDETASATRLSAVREPENLRQVEGELLELKKAGADKGKIASLEKVRSELVELWTKTKLEDVPIVSRKDVAGIVARMTGIPVDEISEDEKDKLLSLEERLHTQIVGQEDAVKAVSEAIRRGRAGLKDPKRPIGSFLFIGPTGVGKTELAKALCLVLYGKDDALVRLDMSEYMEKHAVSRMLGAPPGYIGFEQGGQLTEIVRRRPFSVILLDEIEKAHPEVFNVLLQIMEDGRLTDGQGRVVDFKNVILIMTSNLGSELINKQAIGFENGPKGKIVGREELNSQLQERLRAAFRPEFLNRIDEVIFFDQLNQGQIKQIVSLELDKVRQLLSAQEINLKVTAGAVDWLGTEGYSLEYGARPLRRLIQKEVENPISSKIIAGEYTAGDTVAVGIDRGNLKIDKDK